MVKNFLLVTASIGSGHEKAAMAIAQGIKEKYPQGNINIVDFMRWDISLVNAIMKACYLKMLVLVPNLYEFMYQFTAGKKKGGFIQMIMAQAMSRSIKRLIRRYEPDVIICTHPFPAEAVSHLGADWRKSFASAAVITDYSVHQMWICHNLNQYFVATESMKQQLITDGIREEIIQVTGIPVSPVFHQKLDKSSCRQKLALGDDKPVVVMMGGGLGLGGMNQALSQLEDIGLDIQLVVIAGRNRELYQQAQIMAGHSHHSIQVLGYTNEIREIMTAADLLITKPGALTLTEALYLHLPMVLHEPIPGPETDNARYMAGCGAAVWLHSGDNLACIVQGLLQQPEKLQEMSQNAQVAAQHIPVEEIIKNISTICPNT